MSESKDVIFFTSEAKKEVAKNEYHYLAGKYEHLREVPDYDNDPKYRQYGIPTISIYSPPLLGIFSGFTLGEMSNFFLKRPRLSNLHIHLFSGLAIGLTTAFVSKIYNFRRTQKEIMTWDYVRKHPEDFPEVFNPPKQFKDVLKQWYPVR